MKSIRTSIHKHRNSYLFLAILLLFGIISGILFYVYQDVESKNNILNSASNLFQHNIFDLKNIFYHFLILLTISLCLFCLIGLPILLVYIFLEGISIGFIMPIFLSLYHFQSIIYFLIYFLFIKLLFILLLFLFFIKSILFLKTYILNFKKKNTLFLKNYKNLILIIFLIFINDLIVYFISNPILTWLLGNIKL